MKTNIGVTYVGGKGTVRISDRRTGKGLRNKRKSYWSKIHMDAIKEEMKIRKREKQLERANQYRD